jgi:hypothetical protein
MSMIFTLVGVTPEQGQALRADETLASDLAIVVEGDEDETGRVSPLGAIAQPLVLEKSWHILHYAFTGEAEPTGSPGSMLLEGDEVGEDIGYGPPRLLDPQSTKTFADFLAQQTVEELQARANYAAMKTASIYGLPMGGGDDARHEDAVRREIAAYFPPLRDYVVATAAKNNGLLLWLA